MSHQPLSGNEVQTRSYGSDTRLRCERGGSTDMGHLGHPKEQRPRGQVAQQLRELGMQLGAVCLEGTLGDQAGQHWPPNTRPRDTNRLKMEATQAGPVTEQAAGLLSEVTDTASLSPPRLSGLKTGTENVRVLKTRRR